MPVSEARAALAISRACTSLRRRKAVEEGAHSSVISALNQALKYQGAELQIKVDALQQELSQCYKNQAHVSEQLVVEMQTSQTLKTQLSEKESLFSELETEASSARTRVELLERELEGKEQAVSLLVVELNNSKEQAKVLQTNVTDLQVDNKELTERMMTMKMNEADRLNEINAMYADMQERCKMNSLAELAKKQIDGIVRQSEEGAEHYYMKQGAPKSVKHTFRAHERGCSAMAFEHHSQTLFTAGHDNLVKLWEPGREACTTSLTGALGSITDMALNADNTMLLGGCSDHKLYLWDLRTGRVKHVLTGNGDKITAVDIAQSSNRRAVSSSYDRSIRTWDLQTGYLNHTRIFASNCNAMCFSDDGSVIISGHNDGILRFWDTRSGSHKPSSELTAHEPQAITSVSLSRSGLSVLTSGKDNVVKLFDLRSLELKSSFRGQGYTVATNFCRSSMSADEAHIAAGSGDGSVFIWNRKSPEAEVVLKGAHHSPVLSCCWSEVHKSLATADRSGVVCLWE